MPIQEQKDVMQKDLTKEIPKAVDSLDVADLRVVKDNGLRYAFTITGTVPGSLAATAANYTTAFFIADRTYQVISITERHDVAGTDAGAVTVDVLKASSGTDIGSGTSLLTATFSLKATADTNQAGTVVAGSIVTSGQAIGMESSGTLTDVSGVTIMVKLRAL